MVRKVNGQGMDFSAGPEGSDAVALEVASQWQLMWWKFRKHRLAMAGGAVIIFLYLLVLFAEFFAPYLPGTYNARYVYAPPQPVHFRLHGRPRLFTYGYTFETDITNRKTWFVDHETVIPLGFLVRGDQYKLWGLLRADVHLFGPQNPGDPFFLLGTEKNGRDVLSRLIYSARISLTISLVVVFMITSVGILVGGLAGLLGGWVDNVIQRVIELTMSVPQIPIWLAFAAVLPPHWTPVQRYILISLILSLLGWTGLARVVRSKFLALREEDYVLAATLDGCGRWRLISRHMLPSFLSHIIASVTLAIPGMILGETALSFLGVGLVEPAISWGVMLQEAQRIVSVARCPWLLYPALAVLIAVVSFNFLGDGLRDAADPYR